MNLSPRSVTAWIPAQATTEVCDLRGHNGLGCSNPPELERHRRSRDIVGHGRRIALMTRAGGTELFVFRPIGQAEWDNWGPELCRVRAENGDSPSAGLLEQIYDSNANRVKLCSARAGFQIGWFGWASALQFVLNRPWIVSVLPNFTRMEELRECTAAVDTLPLTDEEQAYLDVQWQNKFYSKTWIRRSGRFRGCIE